MQKELLVICLCVMLISSNGCVLTVQLAEPELSGHKASALETILAITTDLALMATGFYYPLLIDGVAYGVIDLDSSEQEDKKSEK